MGAYITVNDLELSLSRDKILDLAFDSELGGTKDIADATVLANVDGAISRAEEEVNTYILPVHTLPLTGAIPERIKEVSTTLAVYKLYGRRRHASTMNPFQDGYDMAIDWLKLLARGQVQLNFGTAEDPDIKVESRVRTNVDTVNDPKEFTDNF